MEKIGNKDDRSLHLWYLEHIWCDQLLIFGYVDRSLIISPFEVKR